MTEMTEMTEFLFYRVVSVILFELKNVLFVIRITKKKLILKIIRVSYNFDKK